jgi:hypothetical protein
VGEHVHSFPAACAALLCLSFPCAQFSAGQESSSATRVAAASPAATPDAPSAALRDALFAACGQSEEMFSKFLTVRNAETFAHLTPTARVSLMKRFVLLNEPGKPSNAPSASGRPTVRCETPAGTAELQIGGAEIKDNLAFLPIEEREASDTTGNSLVRVKMGLVRENGAWKLLSVGLVLLDLPALAFEWDAAEIQTTERGAIDNVKRIAQAVETYRRLYSRLPEFLAKLGSAAKTTAAGAAHSTPPSADAAGLLDAELVSGSMNGYKFRYVIASASTLGAPAKYEIAATPQVYGRTGKRSFFRDTNGVLHGADRQGGVGSELDPRIE